MDADEVEEEGLSASDLDEDFLGVLELNLGLRAGSEALIAIFVLHITESDHGNSTISPKLRYELKIDTVVIALLIFDYLNYS